MRREGLPGEEVSGKGGTGSWGVGGGGSRPKTLSPERSPAVLWLAGRGSWTGRRTRDGGSGTEPAVPARELCLGRHQPLGTHLGFVIIRSATGTPFSSQSWLGPAAGDAREAKWGPLPSREARRTIAGTGVLRTRARAPWNSSVQFSGAENHSGEIKGHVLFSWGLC